MDVSRTLDAPEQKSAESISVAVGDTVKANEIVAGPGGFLGRLRRRARSPVDGQVKAVRRGQILIETAPRAVDLSARVQGKVIDIIPERGVVIGIVGSLVQGAWGNGGEASGPIWIGPDQASRPLRARHLDRGCQGTIVVAGPVANLEVLERAAMIGIAGLVASSARAELCSSLRGAPFPIMLTEGFGQLPMSEAANSIFQAGRGREAWLHAPSPDCWDSKRPEILIPLETQDSPAEDTGQPVPRVGSLVRCRRAPYVGGQGIISELPVEPHIVDSGLRLPVAEIELEGHSEPVLVPVANLELLY